MFNGRSSFAHAIPDMFGLLLVWSRVKSWRTLCCIDIFFRIICFDGVLKDSTSVLSLAKDISSGVCERVPVQQHKVARLRR